MNLTLTQAIDRAKDLSGLLKGARAHEADCAADHSAKLRIAEIAAEAHKKAASACIELEQEREALADHIAALVRKVGDPLELGAACGHPAPCDAGGCTHTDPPDWVSSDGNGFNSIFTEGADFQAQALQNGLDRIGEIVDAARS